jgi:hypothetical protein
LHAGALQDHHAGYVRRALIVDVADYHVRFGADCDEADSCPDVTAGRTRDSPRGQLAVPDELAAFPADLTPSYDGNPPQWVPRGIPVIASADRTSAEMQSEHLLLAFIDHLTRHYSRPNAVDLTAAQRWQRRRDLARD